MQQNIQRLPQILARTGCSRSTVYQKIQQGLFPPAIQLGARAVGWPSGEIDAVVSALIAEKSEEEIRLLVSELVAARKTAA